MDKKLKEAYTMYGYWAYQLNKMLKEKAGTNGVIPYDGSPEQRDIITRLQQDINKHIHNTTGLRDQDPPMFPGGMGI